MGEAKRRKQVTEGEYLNQLDEMPAEQIEWLDKTLDRLWELAKADGLSHEEFVDLLTRTWEAAGVSDPKAANRWTRLSLKSWASTNGGEAGR